MSKRLYSLAQKRKKNIRRDTRRKFPITENSRCFLCSGKENLHRHHVDGNIYNRKEINIEIVCVDCHKNIHKRD